MKDEDLPVDPIGAAWLARQYGQLPLSRLHVLSQAGGQRRSQVVDGYRLETFPENMRPRQDFASHLQFHLRYEIANFEFLARLFRASGPQPVQEWVDSEPTGQYARRAAFLYEWLTGSELVVPARLAGNYVDALDAERVVAATPERIVKVPRWRINDNIAGTPAFTPLVAKTDAVQEAIQTDVASLFGSLTQEFGEELLLRAAAWMTLRESKASFAIEGEGDKSHSSRIQRFADVMARRTGIGELPLSDRSLAELQQEILGPRHTLKHLGIRESPVFVGETIRFQEIVHYVAPSDQYLSAMLEGVRVFLDRTQGQSSAMRSIVAAFAFVYIHPMADGNGRVHRFLINDVLRRDGAVPAPVILPVSAVIDGDAGERRAYNEVLDAVSKPLMEAVRDKVSFSRANQVEYPDGVVSNFQFTAADEALPLWRYPDLGPHVVYMANVLKRTLTEQMREESRYLRSHHRAREAVKEIVEMPDLQVDRVIRSIEQNGGKLSGALSKEMPVLSQPGVWDAITEAVARAFMGEGQVEDSVVKRYRPM
uniref:Fic family protein n=1 Tax=Hylemonella sp. TaxID=2066020 RepID=UPI0035AF2665